MVVSANALGYDTGGGGLTASQVWQYAVEGAITAEEAMRLFGAALAGKASIAGDVIAYRDMNDTKDRITATTTTDGERTAITLDTA
jgi:hypothetical protein